MRERIHTDAAPKAIGPYSQAVRCGDLLFVSGQIPIDPATGALVPADIRLQTRRVMENLKAIVEAAGMSLAQVVKCTCFLSDMNHFAAFNAVYGEYFGAGESGDGESGRVLPARETVEVGRLPKGALVEVSAVCSA